MRRTLMLALLAVVGAPALAHAADVTIPAPYLAPIRRSTTLIVSSMIERSKSTE